MPKRKVVSVERRVKEIVERQVGPLVDVAVTVPSKDYGPIEDLHMMFDHLCTAYRKRWIEAGCPETP